MSFALPSARSLTQVALGFVARPAAFRVSLGISLADIVNEFILRAVPKQRTSHSKKRMRMAGKGLKSRHDLVPCPGCARPKLAAHICLNCYHDIKRKLKDMKRSEQL
ncbi:hypothetical protein GGI04_003845 [Coemansia thaxteri]|uniref:Large ribosomal subunit protein bL32m n=1 Tax=Coemansia thaxteri TaxID=2663907 RepID=A0A9W8BEQ5_9FUNG|nr:hypothetical protein H4R26_004539 [Coemansia thaxteri]KAJ2001164.1 hypothetical protein GGI04_003845 [Coemansia thaxteri]